MLKASMTCWAIAWTLLGMRLLAAQTDEVAANRLFTNTALLHFQITMPEAGIEALRQEPRTYVEATVQEGETVYTNVSIHLKGSVGSFRKVDDKPGLTMNFKAANPSSFHGLKKIHLNNASQDSTYLSEWVASGLFRQAGLPATRAAHAVVDLNGRKLGLYVMVEGVDRVFLGRYFKNTRGNLYGQSQNGDITEPLERMEGRGEDTHEDLKALAAVAQEHDLAKLRAQLPKVLDVEEFIDFMAMEVMLCHWDGYTMAVHNYRIYHNPDTGKIVFIAHDLDQTIGDANLRIHPRANGLIARDILQIPELRSRYRERMGTLFTNVFVVPNLTNSIDQLVARLMPAMTDYDIGIALSFQNHSKVMKARIINRARSLEQQFSMPEPANLVLAGKVTDADTKKPIPQLTIIPGFNQGENAVAWDRANTFRALNGAFNMDLGAAQLPQYPGFLRFEAPGYLPAILPYRLSTNAADAVCNVALKKGERLTGMVRLPDGSPARGAQVARLTESSSPELGKAELVGKPGFPILRLLDRGRFAFSPDPEAHTIVAVHETGFVEALVDGLTTQPQLTLQPWGRIEGRLIGKDGSAPAAVAVMTAELLIPNLFNGLYSGVLNLDVPSFTAEVPANGSFVMEKVPPGERYLWRSVPINDPTNTSPANLGFVGQRLLIKPGDTHQITWGGNEGSLQGRIDLGEDENTTPDDPEINKPVDAKVPFKLGFLKLTPQSTNNQAPVEFIFTFGSNDCFRISGLASGNYEAELRVYSPPMLLGVATRLSVVVPAASNNSSAATGDLGAIKLQLIKPAAIGDPAPAFELKALDGVPFKLADFRGSYVLLNFWAGWSSPYNIVVPSLKAIWDEYHANPRLVMVGLSLDRSAAAVQRYAIRNAMPWRQAYLGDWFQTALPAEYGVAGIPAAVLIDPEGKIIAQNVSFKDLAAVVKNALYSK